MEKNMNLKLNEIDLPTLETRTFQAGEMVGKTSTALRIRADLSALEKKLTWFSAHLQSRDTRERLDQGLLSRLQEFCLAGGGEAIYRFGTVSTGAANELTIAIECGALFDELDAALRALGFEFHEPDFVD